jgi:hypothetical protein
VSRIPCLKSTNFQPLRSVALQGGFQGSPAKAWGVKSKRNEAVRDENDMGKGNAEESMDPTVSNERSSPDWGGRSKDRGVIIYNMPSTPAVQESTLPHP